MELDVDGGGIVEIIVWYNISDQRLEALVQDGSRDMQPLTYICSCLLRQRIPLHLHPSKLSNWRTSCGPRHDGMTYGNND